MRTKTYRHIIAWTMLIAALLYSMLFIVCGAGNPKDPFYWLVKYSNLETGFMTSGTILIAHLWLRLTSKTIFSMRLLGWLCTTLAIALPYCLLLSSRERRDNIHWLALTYWLMGYGSFQEFSPGTISVLLLSLTVTMLLSARSYRGRPLLFGLLLAALVLVRFPNILVIPLLLLYILIPAIGKRLTWAELYSARTRDILLGIASSVLFYALGWLGWYYGMHHTVAAPAALHTINMMLDKMWTEGYRLIADIALWAAFFYLLSLTNRPMRTAWKYAISILSGALMLYYVNFAFPATQWYNIDQCYLISTLVIFLTLVLSRQLSSRQDVLSVVCALLIMSVAALGTDTAFLKLFPALLCLLPLWAARIKWPCPKRYILLSLSIVTVLFVVRFSTNAIGKHNIFRENTWGQTSIMRYTRISEHEDQQMQHILTDYAQYQTTAPVYALGDKMHMVRALTGCEQPAKNEFWSNIFDKVYTRWYSELVSTEHPVFICTFSPSFRTKPEYRDKHSALEQMLLDSGYTAIDRSEFEYMIYVKK